MSASIWVLERTPRSHFSLFHTLRPAIRLPRAKCLQGGEAAYAVCLRRLFGSNMHYSNPVRQAYERYAYIVRDAAPVVGEAGLVRGLHSIEL